MHITKIPDDENNWWYIHYNGDYSGHVVFTKFNEDETVVITEFSVPFDVLEQLVGYKVQSDLMEKLESMDGHETLRFLYE